MVVPRVRQGMRGHAGFSSLRFILADRRVRIGGLVVMVLAGIGWWSGGIDLADWHDRARACPGAGVFAALILLPLAGVPVSVMHAIVGPRFGV